jgi:hypothetical protein
MLQPSDVDRVTDKDPKLLQSIECRTGAIRIVLKNASDSHRANVGQSSQNYNHKAIDLRQRPSEALALAKISHRFSTEIGDEHFENHARWRACSYGNHPTSLASVSGWPLRPATWCA